jgi:hypothetical protein
MLADQADGGLYIVEGNGDDVGQHIVRRTPGIGDRNRRIAAPRLRRRIEAYFGVSRRNRDRRPRIWRFSDGR